MQRLARLYIGQIRFYRLVSSVLSSTLSPNGLTSSAQNIKVRALVERDASGYLLSVDIRFTPFSSSCLRMTALSSARARYAGCSKENNLDANVRSAWHFSSISLCFTGHRLSAADTNSIEIHHPPLRRTRLDGRRTDWHRQNGCVWIAFTATTRPSKRTRATAATKVTDFSAHP